MEYKSPSFSNFRQLMDLWDESLKQDKINTLVNGNNFVLFFKKNDSIYGAPESSRVIFAKMKNPDSETDQGWLDEASFIAVNLTKALDGKQQKEIFNYKDIKGMKIIDEESAEKMLGKKDAKNITTSVGDEPEKPTPDDSPNLDKISEK